jgi:hypothetical protein
MKGEYDMIRIPDNVLTFANGNVDLYKAWGDYFNHYRAVNFKTNVDYDRNVSFEEKTEKLHKAIEARIGEVAGINNTGFSDAVWKTNPNYRWATFAVIGSMIDMVIPEVVVDDFMQFAEVRNGGFGDTFVFDIASSDLFIVTTGANGKRHTFEQRQFNSQVSLVPETRFITVAEDLYRILCGKRNLAEYAMKCALAMEKELSIDVYKAINDTYAKLPTNFKEASFTVDGFVKLAQRVQAANGGARCVVFGTKLGLSKILPSNDYLKMQLGDIYNRMGYLTTFMGVDLFEIPQKIDDAAGDYSFALEDDKLYFISTGVQKLVKIGFEGDTITITDGQYANANLTQATTLQKRWAVGVATNAKYGMMDVIA